MTEFAVGDRVRVLLREPDLVGKKATITKVTAKWIFVNIDATTPWPACFRHDEIEKITKGESR